MNERSAGARAEVLKGFRVKELLEATRRVIGRHGFQGATIDRVAEEAGVAKGTVYLYFANKDELLHAAVLEGLREMNQHLRGVGSAMSSPLERLKTLVREQFRMLNSNQDFFKALILENSFVTFKPGDPHAEELLRVYTSYLDLGAAVLEQAMERGEIRRLDPQLAAFMLGEMVTGSLRRRALGLAATPVEADVDAVLELFLNGVLAAQGGAKA